jgi:hypothetical protein
MCACSRRMLLQPSQSWATLPAQTRWAPGIAYAFRSLLQLRAYPLGLVCLVSARPFVVSTRRYVHVPPTRRYVHVPSW